MQMSRHARAPNWQLAKYYMGKTAPSQIEDPVLRNFVVREARIDRDAAAARATAVKGCLKDDQGYGEGGDGEDGAGVGAAGEHVVEAAGSRPRPNDAGGADGESRAVSPH